MRGLQRGGVRGLLHPHELQVLWVRAMRGLCNRVRAVSFIVVNPIRLLSKKGWVFLWVFTSKAKKGTKGSRPWWEKPRDCGQRGMVRVVGIGSHGTEGLRRLNGTYSCLWGLAFGRQQQDW